MSLNATALAPAGGAELYTAACQLREALRGRALLLVEDRTDIAEAAEADGVVLSQRGACARRRRAPGCPGTHARLARACISACHSRYWARRPCAARWLLDDAACLVGYFCPSHTGYACPTMGMRRRRADGGGRAHAAKRGAGRPPGRLRNGGWGRRRRRREPRDPGRRAPPPPEGEGGRRGCGAQQERRLPRGLRRPVHERQAQPASRMRAARPGTGCSGCTADAVLRSQRARCENRAHSCKSPSMAAGREATQG